MSSGTHIDPEKLNGRGKETIEGRFFFQNQINETEKKKTLIEGM